MSEEKTEKAISKEHAEQIWKTILTMAEMRSLTMALKKNGRRSGQRPPLPGQANYSTASPCRWRSSSNARAAFSRKSEQSGPRSTPFSLQR